MSEEPVTDLPHGVEELRADLHRIVKNYPLLTVVEMVGVLELVKADMFEALRQSDQNR
jgi:hypothetical protein